MRLRFACRLTLISVLCLSGAVAFAKSFEVAAWRGETVAARVPDFAELGSAPAGIGVKVGVLRTVKCAPTAESLQRIEVCDRVDWTTSVGGPRVVEVSVPVDAKPGIYACGAMNVRVVDRVLPPAREWKYYLDLWQHPWAVARLANVKPFSPEHYAKMRPVWELLATAGQKTITATLLPEPWDHQCRDAYGSMIAREKVKGKGQGQEWRFDYSVFDEYVEFARSCGLGPDICCYTMCPWEYVVRWNDEKGGEHSAVAKPGTAAFEDYWGPFLDDFARHLEAKGWLKDTLISMDERSAEDVKLIGEFVRKHVPTMRLSMAGDKLPSQYGVTLDAFCLRLDHCRNEDLFKEAAARRAKGLVTTYYVCCWPPTPNTFLTSGAGEAYWLGAYPALSGLDGFLRWAWNSWPEDPRTDASYGTWMSGDPFLCYPGGEPSWRFLELRNGIVAAEKIRILKERGLFAEEINSVAALYSADKAVTNGCDFVAIRQKTQDLINRQE